MDLPASMSVVAEETRRWSWLAGSLLAGLGRRRRHRRDEIADSPRGSSATGRAKRRVPAVGYPRSGRVRLCSTSCMRGSSSHISERSRRRGQEALQTPASGRTYRSRGHRFQRVFCVPGVEGIWRYCELYCATVVRRGGDPNIGLRLPELLKQGGFEAVGISAVQPIAMEGEVKLLGPLTMENIAGAVLADRLSFAIRDRRPGPRAL